jgi:hypothetical protein
MYKFKGYQAQKGAKMALDFSAGIGSGPADFISSGFNAVGGLSASLVGPQLTNSGPQVAPTQVAQLDGLATPVGIHQGTGKILPVGASGGLISDIQGNMRGNGFVDPGWSSSTIKALKIQLGP